MNIRCISSVLLAISGLLAAPADGRAQGGLKQLSPQLHDIHERMKQKSGRYVSIPFEGNVEALFKDRLQFAKDLEPLKKMLDEARGNPGKFNIPPGLLDRVDLSNPVLRALIKRWRDKQPPGTPFTLESLKDIQEELERLTGKVDAEAILKDLGGSTPGGQGGASVQAEAEQGSPWDPDQLNRWLEEWLKNVDQTTLGDWLKDSPAFQRGVADFHRLMRLDKGGLNLGQLPPHLRLPEGLSWRLGDSALSRLRNFSPPTLPHVELPRIRIGGFSLPSIPLPRLGAPAGGGNLLEVGLWVAGFAVMGFLSWRWLRRFGPRRGVVAKGATLGAWPVDPAAVTTRAELVRAFDYLAFLLLGPQVRPWNHRAVARELQAADGRTAHELADLYERARYLPGSEPLSPEEQSAARRCLNALAGGSR